MSARACIYKRCANHKLQGAQSNAVSLFKFPKNPERRRKWMELGQAPHDLPESAYYYCSNHFETKFLSRNKRRTLLVGEAVPLAYEEQQFEKFHERVQLSLDDEDTTYVLVEEISASPNSEKQQQLQIECTTTQEDNTCSTNEEKINTILNESFIDERDSDKNKVEQPKRKGIKRNTSNYSEPKKRKIISAISSTQEDISLNGSFMSQPGEEKDNILLLKSCDTPLPSIDTEHISTFIFKGEEFVQMSKDYYINEKKRFRKRIQKLESVLSAIKFQILTIDF